MGDAVPAPAFVLRTEPFCLGPPGFNPYRKRTLKMDYSIWMTERTRAHIEGRAEKAALMLQNKKPFRNKAQKESARRSASIRSDGAWRSDAPVSFHPAPRGAA